MKKTLLLLVLVAFCSTAYGQADQVRINEVDPEGKWIELYYPASATGDVDVSNFCLCSRPTYEAVGAQTLMQGSLSMSPGDYVVVGWKPVTNFTTSQGEVGLYATCSNFTVAANMVDYLEYGAVLGSSRENVAVEKGIWTPNTFVPLAASGKTLSFFGGASGANNWADGDPTQGVGNVGAGLSGVAYVSSSATGNGSIGDPGDPYPSMAAAVAAGADELRIAAGTYVGDLEVGGLDYVFRTWNGQAGAGEALDVTEEVIIDGSLKVQTATSLTLNAAESEFVVQGDIDLEGLLDLGDNILTMEDANGAVTFTLDLTGEIVGEEASGKRGRGSILRARSQETLATVDMVTSEQFNTRNVEVELELITKLPSMVNINSSGNSNGTSTINLRNLTVRGVGGSGGRVFINENIARINIDKNFEQYGGQVDMAGSHQTLSTGGDFALESGTFGANNADVEVGGNYFQGPNRGQDPGNALFRLGSGGTHSIVGDFNIGPNLDDNSNQAFDRNRYETGFGQVRFGGNVNFLGSADFYEDPTFKGFGALAGDSEFIGEGEAPLEIFFSVDLDFVRYSGASDLIMTGDLNNTPFSTNNLDGGIIHTNGFNFHMANPNPERDLINRTTVNSGEGVFTGGSNSSFVNGPVERVLFGPTSEVGVITGGYVYPVGTTGEAQDPPRDVDFFRPLTLQLREGLSSTIKARVNYLEIIDRPEFKYDDPIEAPDGQGSLTLDAIGDQFWQLEFDRIPSFDPNVRVEAGGQDNIFDISKMRLIQWDCDGMNPRLAGTFTGDMTGTSIRNAFINDEPNITMTDVTVGSCQIFGLATNQAINPIVPVKVSDFSVTKTATPTNVVKGNLLTYTVVVTNNGPDVGSGSLTDTLPDNVDFVFASRDDGGQCARDGNTVTCALTDIASGASVTVTIGVIPSATGTITNSATVASEQDNNAENNTATADATVVEPAMGDMQFFQALSKPVDVYVDDKRVVDDFMPRSATSFMMFPASEVTIDLTDSEAPDNSTPFFTETFTLKVDVNYSAVFAATENGGTTFNTFEGARRMSLDSKRADVNFFHGSPGVSDLNVDLIDVNGIELGMFSSLKYGAYSDYITTSAEKQTFFIEDAATDQILSATQADLSGQQGEVYTAIIMLPVIPKRADAIELLLFGTDGALFETTIVTSNEIAEGVPETFALHENYPNPFNPTTQIRYDLAKSVDVRLTVFDVLGREVRTLVASEQASGTYSITWDARTNNGAQVGSGLYLYRLEAGTFAETRRMLMVK